MSTKDCISLETIAGGAVRELFSEKLAEVLKNITDPNTDWKATRKISLDFLIRANEEREVGGVSIKASAKLAGLKPVETVVFIGRQDGQLVAVEHNPKQGQLFDAPNKNVVNMNGGSR